MHATGSHQSHRLAFSAGSAQSGYPLPVNGKTDPSVDKIIHDKGVHFCSDTDRPRHAKTALPAVTVGHNEYNSRIWSGNFADGGRNYTYVHLQWNESCIAWGTNDWYSTWAGIGGVNNNNLEQAGVDGVNSGVFSHYYEAWIQNTASSLDSNVFGVNCGDSMLVEIGAGDCMYISDLSSGATTGWRCNSPGFNTSTAECIIEAPTVNGSIAPLSNYGTETLRYCDVEINGGSTTGINNVPHDYFNMYNGGTLLSSTGPISGGDTYTMTWHNYYY